MIKENLVDNKHLQLQLLFIQFLSVAFADSADNSIEEMKENSNPTTTSSNQIAGKLFTVEIAKSYMSVSSNYRYLQRRFLKIKCND